MQTVIIGLATVTVAAAMLRGLAVVARLPRDRAAAWRRCAAGARRTSFATGAAGPLGRLVRSLQRGGRRRPGADRPAGAGPPAADRRAGGDGRGGHRRRPPPPAALRQRQRQSALRARRDLRRPAGPRADPQPPGPGSRRGDPPADRPRRLSGRADAARPRRIHARPGPVVISPCAAPPCPASPSPGAVLVFHDVTDLRRLERMRQDFVANASHELKTPLASIKAYTETLLDWALHDETVNVRFLERIDEQAERLNQLILDLLSLARLESGPGDLRPPAARASSRCSSRASRPTAAAPTPRTWT